MKLTAATFALFVAICYMLEVSSWIYLVGALMGTFMGTFMGTLISRVANNFKYPYQVTILHDCGKDPAQDDLAAILVIAAVLNSKINGRIEITLAAHGANPEMSNNWALKVSTAIHQKYPRITFSYYVAEKTKGCKAIVQDCETSDFTGLTFEDFYRKVKASEYVFVHSFHARTFRMLYGRDQKVFCNSTLILQGAPKDDDVKSTFNEDWFTDPYHKKSSLWSRSVIFGTFKKVYIHDRNLAYSAMQMSYDDLTRLGKVYQKLGIVSSVPEFLELILAGTKKFCITGASVFSRLPAFCNKELFSSGPYNPMLEEILTFNKSLVKNNDNHPITKEGIQELLVESDPNGYTPKALRAVLLQMLHDGEELVVNHEALDKYLKKHNRLPMYDPISAVVLSQLLGENLGMTMQENEHGFFVVKDFIVPLKETFFKIIEGI